MDDNRKAFGIICLNIPGGEQIVITRKKVTSDEFDRIFMGIPDYKLKLPECGIVALNAHIASSCYFGISTRKEAEEFAEHYHENIMRMWTNNVE